MVLNTLFDFWVIHYREHSSMALMLLVKCQSLGNTIDLNQLLKFSITHKPLGTFDGFLNKTNKANKPA